MYFQQLNGWWLENNGKGNHMNAIWVHLIFDDSSWKYWRWSEYFQAFSVMDSNHFTMTDFRCNAWKTYWKNLKWAAILQFVVKLLIWTLLLCIRMKTHLIQLIWSIAYLCLNGCNFLKQLKNRFSHRKTLTR